MSIFQRIKTPFGETAEAQDMPAPRRSAVGELLRARREQLELDLDHIGEALRIRPSYLAALEQGRIEELPGPAYAMGFVRAYADYLGFDGDRVLARYKADTADVHARPDLALPVPLGERSLPGGPILLVALILALCGYGTWYYLSTDERARPERVAAVPAELRDPAAMPPPAAPPVPAAAPATRPAAPPGFDTDAPKPNAAAVPGDEPRPAAEPASAERAPPSSSAKPSVTVVAPPLPNTRASGAAPSDPIVFPGTSPMPQATAAAQQPAAPPPPAATPTASPVPAAIPAPDPASQSAAGAAPAGGGLLDGRIAIRALADCWIQVRAADQSVVFSRVLKAGETYHVPARSGLSMRTGNAGALAIEVDGKAAPAIGPLGSLRRNVALDPDSLVAGTAVHG